MFSVSALSISAWSNFWIPSFCYGAWWYGVRKVNNISDRLGEKRKKEKKERTREKKERKRKRGKGDKEK